MAAGKKIIIKKNLGEADVPIGFALLFSIKIQMNNQKITLIPQQYNILHTAKNRSKLAKSHRSDK